MKDTRIFALYKGDEYIMDGTCEPHIVNASMRLMMAFDVSKYELTEDTQND